jgi:hypothetical protein
MPITSGRLIDPIQNFWEVMILQGGLCLNANDSPNYTHLLDTVCKFLGGYDIAMMSVRMNTADIEQDMPITSGRLIDPIQNFWKVVISDIAMMYVCLNANDPPNYTHRLNTVCKFLGYYDAAHK